ncbi:MAG: hypothetical protein HDS31_06965 [Bacteroides sp.]|nr:hypothetical protein [Bacteroides sp.]
MQIKTFLLFLALTAGAATALADDFDNEGYPVFYVRGDMTNNWGVDEAYKLTRTGDTYSITLNSLNGSFKISGTNWEYNYGSPLDYDPEISDAYSFMGTWEGRNIVANNLHDVTISFNFTKGQTREASTPIYIAANGHEAPELGKEIVAGALPVLHINVFKEGTREYDNEIIDYNLDHKNYFSGEYWLDMNGCEWMAEEYGAEDIGSEEEPLALEIKARGNYTRTGFSKKPFKLKLGSKEKMLGLSKSKHFALLAHADDTFGYLRSFTGFSLGKRIGLPWTPSQQPVEVYINGDYRGLYFLTESIRIEKDRVNIVELDDLEENPEYITGGYLVELDNYEEENQIRMDERFCTPREAHIRNELLITWDTPEEYSDLQKRFVRDHFTAMNDAVGDNSDLLWSYLDLDDAARYYIVEEIMSHTESYHGSTYLFRDRGANQKWHFSPLWDFGNAFNGYTNQFFYNCDPYGNTWIDSMRENGTFNTKVNATWLWFMNNGFKGIEDEMREYTDHISEAAKRDRTRWANAPTPNHWQATPVVDNSNISEKRDWAINHLNDKVNWLRSQFGDYAAVPNATEPQRDTTPAAPLPDYVTATGLIGIADPAFSFENATYYTLEGTRVNNPVAGRIYIVVTPKGTAKVKF